MLLIDKLIFTLYILNYETTDNDIDEFCSKLINKLDKQNISVNVYETSSDCYTLNENDDYIDFTNIIIDIQGTGCDNMTMLKKIQLAINDIKFELFSDYTIFDGYNDFKHLYYKGFS